MSELTDALRQLATVLDADSAYAPTACAVAFSDPTGAMKAIYIGRESPVDAALIHLLARGIEQTVLSKLAGTMTQTPVEGAADISVDSPGFISRSTH